MTKDFDVIVVGAGHAGCEAAAAAAKLGSKTLLITLDLTKMAAMSCNPAIGGIAKGQIVREIDALGGYTGIATDKSSIQFRMLNKSKGPAMWSPRSQCDKAQFSRNWRSYLESIDNLFFWQDSVVSQRALREIYLKGFEIAVRNGADSVMTTYGKLNGLYTSSSYDLNTVILRKEWGFKGIVMTDWWAFINEIGCEPDKSNFAAMVRAQNDLYMCCSDGSRNSDGDNTLVSLQNGNLTRAELQRAAMNVCNHVMHTQAMARLIGTNETIEIINRPVSNDEANLDDVIFYVVEHDKPFEIDLSQKNSVAGTNYILSFDVRDIGTYRLTLFGSSELGELAQLPCSLFFQGIPTATFVFNGSNGKTVSITKDIACPTRFSTFRLFVSQNGLKLDKLKVEFVGKEYKSFFNI